MAHAALSRGVLSTVLQLPTGTAATAHQQLFLLVDDLCADWAAARCSCRQHGTAQLLTV